MPELSPDVLDLLARQDQVVSRRQLLAGGVSKAAIRWNSGRSWRVLLPCVYLTSRAEPTERQRQIAALLYSGPGSAITGRHAAAHFGLDAGAGTSRIEVVTPPTRKRRSTGFVVVRPSLVVDQHLVELGPLRFVSPGRACVDAACVRTSPRARQALFIEAVQKQLVSLDDLAEWVFRLRPRDAASLHEALVAAGTGTWSLPEHDLLELVGGSSVLPTPWANPRLVDASGAPLLTPDAWFDDVAMAVMVHSRRFHADGDAWDETILRDAGLVAAGVVVAGVTPRQVATDPGGVLARLERTYASAATRPRPAVRAYASDPWVQTPPAS